MPYLTLLLFLFGWLQPTLVQHSVPRAKPIPFDPASQWLWTKEEWTTQGDMPLHTWREQLEVRYTSVDIPATVVEQYKQAALQAPQDKRKLFQWGYAAYLLYRSDPAHSRDFQLIRMLIKAKPPYSYEFQRMHYLVEVSQGLGNEQVTAVGERLAKADPKDYFIWAYLSRSVPNNTPEGKRKALEYAQQMIQLDPNRAIGYGAIANVYYSIWIQSAANDTDAARQAVQNYQEYLKRETRPNQASNKKVAHEIIDHLNDQIAKSDKGKGKN